jgi:hypothetical protein
MYYNIKTWKIIGLAEKEEATKRSTIQNHEDSGNKFKSTSFKIQSKGVSKEIKIGKLGWNLLTKFNIQVGHIVCPLTCGNEPRFCIMIGRIITKMLC